MKTISALVSLASFLVLSVCLDAQGSLNERLTSDLGHQEDTLITSSSADTIYLWPDGTSNATARKFRDRGVLDVAARVDSLAGATNATLYVEYCYDRACTDPIRVDTLAINGNTLHYNRWRDEHFSAAYFRLALVAPSSSQTTRFRGAYGFRKY